MKFSFPVIVKKTAATDMGDAILIPRLGITKTLSEAEKSQIEKTGLKPYLESLLLSILAEKSRENEYIEHPKMIDGLIDTFLNKNSQIELYPHDLILTIEVEFEIRTRQRFFSTCLPPLMKLTILIEMSADMILSIGTLALTENGFIPMSADTSKVVTITQSALSTALNLWIALSGPGMAFIENFGVSIDNRLNRTCSKKPVTSPETEDMPGEEKPSSSAQAKIRLVQGLFLLLVVNSLWTGVTMDYQQMTLLTTQLEDATNSLFPDWLISAAAYTAFSFNQLNDPVMLVSLLSVGFKMIHSYFTKTEPVPVAATSQANHRNALLYNRRNTVLDTILLREDALGRKLSLNHG